MYCLTKNVNSEIVRQLGLLQLAYSVVQLKINHTPITKTHVLCLPFFQNIAWLYQHLAYPAACVQSGMFQVSFVSTVTSFPLVQNLCLAEVNEQRVELYE